MGVDNSIGFSLDEKVVYPTHGVGVINEITEKTLNGEKVNYYVITFPSLDMNILLPVANASSLGLRRLSGEEDIKKAIQSLSERKEIHSPDWKSRQQTQLSMLKTGTIANVAAVVNILYNRQKVRDLPIQERRLLETALTQLVDECSYVLGIDSESARRTIFSHLERLKSTP